MVYPVVLLIVFQKARWKETFSASGQESRPIHAIPIVAAQDKKVNVKKFASIGANIGAGVAAVITVVYFLEDPFWLLIAPSWIIGFIVIGWAAGALIGALRSSS